MADFLSCLLITLVLLLAALGIGLAIAPGALEESRMVAPASITAITSAALILLLLSPHLSASRDAIKRMPRHALIWIGIGCLLAVIYWLSR